MLFLTTQLRRAIGWFFCPTNQRRTNAMEKNKNLKEIIKSFNQLQFSAYFEWRIAATL